MAHVVRKLQVGDFLWVAKDNTGRSGRRSRYHRSMGGDYHGGLIFICCNYHIVSVPVDHALYFFDKYTVSWFRDQSVVFLHLLAKHGYLASPSSLSLCFSLSCSPTTFSPPIFSSFCITLEKLEWIIRTWDHNVISKSS